MSNKLSYALAGTAAASIAKQVTRMLTSDMYKAGKRTFSKRTYKKKPAKRAKTTNVISVSKRHQVTQPYTLFKFHNIKGVHLTDIERGTNLDQRERDQIYLTGVKLNLFFRVVQPPPAGTDVYSMFSVRLLVLQEKYNTQSVSSIDLKDQLYQGFSTTRVTDFSDHASGLQTLTLPINRDRYEVFYDKRVDLEQQVHKENPGFMKMHDVYVPIGKMIRYSDSTSDKCTNPVLFAFVIDDPLWAAVGEGTQDVVGMRIVGRAYFRDMV